MKVINEQKLEELSQIVDCPNGEFRSLRYLLKKDTMGFTVTRTQIPKGGPYNWHYKNNLEACLCVKGSGQVWVNGGDRYDIREGSMYVLDGNENHFFEAKEDVELVCVFNPPLDGSEVHGEDRSYESSFQSPVYNVRAVPIEKVKANDYNPNAVAPPEMELLETSIWEDGYTQPVVTYYDSEEDVFIVVDGFHRYLTLKNSKRIFEREKGLLPVVVINKEMGDRMASTIRHNRARGTHSIDLMSNIVAELVEMGKGDAWICKHIGMSKDELLRLKQITGVAALFKNDDFSKAWDVEME